MGGLPSSRCSRAAGHAARDMVRKSSRTALRGSTMDSKSRLMLTLLVTFLNLGLRSDFLVQWAKAYAIAWPVAATTAFVIMPGARRLTDRIVARLDGRS